MSSITSAYGNRRYNALNREAGSIETALLYDQRGLRELERIVELHPDKRVRDHAERALDPGGVPDTPKGMPAFLAHPKVALGDAGIEVRSMIFFGENGRQHSALGEWSYAEAVQTSIDWSWLGGVPCGPLAFWPRGSDGTPLSFIAQLDLSLLQRTEEYGAWAAERFLPTHGLLQVFHDRRTPGRASEDRDGVAWLIRHVADPEGPIDRPDDLGPDGERPQGLVQPTFDVALPRAEWLRLDAKQSVRFAQVTEKWLTSVNAVRTWGQEGPPSEQDLHRVNSHWFGYPTSDDPSTADRLCRALPIESGDSHVLLFEAVGSGVLDGWFPGGGSLEFWIRQSDLERRAYDRAWARIAPP